MSAIVPCRRVMNRARRPRRSTLEGPGQGGRACARPRQVEALFGDALARYKLGLEELRDGRSSTAKSLGTGPGAGGVRSTDGLRVRTGDDRGAPHRGLRNPGATAPKPAPSGPPQSPAVRGNHRVRGERGAVGAAADAGDRWIIHASVRALTRGRARGAGRPVATWHGERRFLATCSRCLPVANSRASAGAWDVFGSLRRQPIRLKTSTGRLEVQPIRRDDSRARAGVLAGLRSTEVQRRYRGFELEGACGHYGA